MLQNKINEPLSLFLKMCFSLSNLPELSSFWELLNEQKIFPSHKSPFQHKVRFLNETQGLTHFDGTPTQTEKWRTSIVPVPRERI